MKFKKLLIALLAVILCMPGFAQAAEPSAPKLTLISNVNIFDGKTEKLHQNMHVLVKDNLIETISSEPLAVIQTDNVTMIDGGGRTLMPGLIDVHWHTYYANIPVSTLTTGDMSEVAIKGFVGAEKTLMRGFTTVRDIGGNPFAVKKLTDTGEYPGPRMYISGPPMCQTGGHFDFNGKNDVPSNSADALPYWERVGLVALADGVPEVTKGAREILRMGATQIKIAGGGGVTSLYDPVDVQEYTFEEMKAVVDVAKTWNTYVAAHIFTDAAIQTAVKAGIKSIEHGNLIKEKKTLQMMKDNGVWLSAQPLLNDEDALKFDNPISTAKFIEVTDGTSRNYKMAKEMGVKIAFGTDCLFDPSSAALQGKLLAKMKLWFTPYEVLKMATSDNAELLMLSGPRNPYQQGPLGVIEKGAYADLILIDGNPLENIDLVADAEKNFVMIMKDGKIYKNTVK
ncbi:metal-dependent hydrolase family protein [Desulforhopalus sp. 52FAK]